MNTYEGHVFYCTNEQKTIEYARFRMTQDQVLYIVSDSKNPPPAYILEHRQKEEVFLKEYLNKTGMTAEQVACFSYMQVLISWACDDVLRDPLETLLRNNRTSASSYVSHVAC